ncbi:hypothetical protein DERF_012001 [Dermatophagoides farinae]|uniref:Uncharacterized protein n=1 Tax=Dermatophagoides farinae TaxID=6954 RepID=A0A922HRQ5_DERFA|nr:hypothetical protein DERF_012001 [Dermatophagoides farinae]
MKITFKITRLHLLRYNADDHQRIKLINNSNVCWTTLFNVYTPDSNLTELTLNIITCGSNEWFEWEKSFRAKLKFFKKMLQESFQEK